MGFTPSSRSPATQKVSGYILIRNGRVPFRRPCREERVKSLLVINGGCLYVEAELKGEQYVRLFSLLGQAKKTMGKKGKREKRKSYNERFIRWQQVTISQLSFTNNLFLGLNLGFLGFFVTQSGLIICGIFWTFTIQVLTLLGLGVSFFTGLFLTINRLKDFRKTTQLIKNRKAKFEHDHKFKTSDNIDSINFTISSLKAETDRLGKVSWTLLNWQIWTFLIGAILGVMYIAITKNVC